jgi:hypothetical protein
MACAGCTTHSGEGTPVGCRSNGNCSTGGCNRMNSFDWLTRLEVEDVEPSHLVEISFKNGSRKGIYMNPPSYPFNYRRSGSGGSERRL